MRQQDIIKVPKLSSQDDVNELEDSRAEQRRRSRDIEGGGHLSVSEKPLKAPFPYPGGKSRVADLVWERLSDVDNYVEPFAGSLACLLRRPAEHFANGYRVETVNDANHYLVNFWRAVKFAPDEVAEWADWPVMEADLHARHKWLVRSHHAADWRQKMAADAEHFDAKMAGWWVWGQCCWIGGAWCNDGFVDRTMIPSNNQDGHGYGLNRGDMSNKMPSAPRPNGSSTSGNSKGILAERIGDMAAGRPQLTDAFDIGRGVNSGGSASVEWQAKPHITHNGNGVAASSIDWTQVPDIANQRSGHGVCGQRREWLIDWMRRLSDRLRLVRTCYGHWSRICDSDSTMTRLGLTGVFLDPPYPSLKADGTKSRDDSLYVNDKHQDLNKLRDEVLAWCRKWSGPQVRIAVCGYEGDGYEALVSEGWAEHSWEAGGGYANQRRGGKGKSENAKRERIWFSPSCAVVAEAGLFGEVV